MSFFVGSLINWGSKKQKGTVALSSMEAETVASTHGIKDATWIQKLMFKVNNPYYGLINVCIDNQAVIYFGNAAINHTHMTH